MTTGGQTLLVQGGSGTAAAPRNYWLVGRTLVDRTCPVCGRVFGARESDIRRGRGKNCSKKCSAAAMRSASTAYPPRQPEPVYAPLAEFQPGEQFRVQSDGTMKRIGTVIALRLDRDAVVVSISGRRMPWHMAIRVERMQ